jgi:hypothetical protein
MVTTIKLNYNKRLAGWLAYLWSNGSAACPPYHKFKPTSHKQFKIGNVSMKFPQK